MQKLTIESLRVLIKEEIAKLNPSKSKGRLLFDLVSLLLSAFL